MKAALFNSLLCGILLAITCAPASMAEMLVGGVTVNDALLPSPQPNKLASMSGEKYDRADSPAQKPQDCICFNRQAVEAKEINGSWKIVDGNHWILDFAANSAEAKMAEKTIRTYKMNEICFVGRGTARPMMFFLSDGAAPVGSVEGEDAISIDPGMVKAEQIKGSWKITCADNWMEDFASDAGLAREGAGYIKQYGFTKHCYIGRPNAPMEYFAK